MSPSLYTSPTFSEEKLCPDDHWLIQSPCSFPCSLSQDVALFSSVLDLVVALNIVDQSICCAVLSLSPAFSLHLRTTLPTSFELRQNPTIWFNSLHSWRLQHLILGPHHQFCLCILSRLSHFISINPSSVLGIFMCVSLTLTSCQNSVSNIKISTQIQ